MKSCLPCSTNPRSLQKRQSPKRLLITKSNRALGHFVSVEEMFRLSPYVVHLEYKGANSPKPNRNKLKLVNRFNSKTVETFYC